MKKVILYLLLSFITFNLSAQGLDKSYKTFDLAMSGGGTGFSPSLSFTQMFSIGKSYRFKIGYGVRVTSYFGGAANFRTAPAKFTSGASSFAALVSDDIVANIDTFSVKSFQTNALVACFFGIAAHTIMVVRPPPRIRNRPRDCSRGLSLLQKMTNAVHDQVMSRNATYECHGSIT